MNFSLFANMVIGGIYYVLAAVMVFLAAFGIYVLIKYGEKRGLSLVVALVFSFFFLTILAQSHSTLQNIV
ncbi:MAG: hypothetical protein AAB410_02495 [Patescibacteria group bacterium]